MRDLLMILAGVLFVGAFVYGVFFGGNLLLIVGVVAVVVTLAYYRFLNREP